MPQANDLIRVFAMVAERLRSGVLGAAWIANVHIFRRVTIGGCLPHQ
jgi:hypothetical protein